MMNPDILTTQKFDKLIFSDDFSAGVLDDTKWSIRVTGKQHNLEEQAYINSGETVYLFQEEDVSDEPGWVLALQPRYRPDYRTPGGDRYDFVSGKLDTFGKFDFTYGLVSARMKLPSGDGFWPAFWLLGNGQWPESGEIDIMENVGDPSWISSGVHGPGYSGDLGPVNSFYFPETNNTEDWHVYSVSWTSDMIEFFVDDVLFNKVTKPMIDYFGNWVFDNPKHIILNFAIGGTYPFKRNAIKTPYYGMPQRTVEKIRNNQVRALVDWVRVYQ